jgi:hypothetical protein
MWTHLQQRACLPENNVSLMQARGIKRRPVCALCVLVRQSSGLNGAVVTTGTLTWRPNCCQSRPCVASAGHEDHTMLVHNLIGQVDEPVSKVDEVK